MANLPYFGPTLDSVLAKGLIEGETHRTLPRIAAGLRGILPPEKIRDFLRKACDATVTHRRVPDREIDAAIQFVMTDRETMDGRRRPKWPEPDPAAIQSLTGYPAPFFLEGRGEDGDTGIRGLDAILTLFRPEEGVCVGRDPYDATVTYAGWAAQHTPWFQFIVANPMRGAYALTQAGKPSPRCQANVAQRRHLVVEFDGHPKPLQASLIGYLATLLPLRMVVDAAGKSLHAWFAAHPDPAHCLAFYFLAVKLGADQTRWDIAGWVRMPGGMRPRPDGQHLQRIVYLR